MNAISISHWGIHEFADNEHMQNLFVNADGSFSPFDEAEDFKIVFSYDLVPVGELWSFGPVQSSR